MCKTLAPPPMFPSPQGGSETIQQISKFPIARQFPSPQGGSETCAMPVALQSLCSVSIPSRRVGDHKGTPLIVAVKLVSNPSRRVGDLRDAGRIAEPLFGFHPLKAGRRPKRKATHCCGQTRFHTLKAGRRRKNMCNTVSPPPMFPSPQGGS
jgi:hypothetical protein